MVTMKYFTIISMICLEQLCADPFSTAFSDSTAHVILLIIDGLSYKVWDKMDLPNLRKLSDRRVIVEKNYLPPAAHPTAGAYAELHSGSIPNPIKANINT